jgi:hypothetical protein
VGEHAACVSVCLEKGGRVRVRWFQSPLFPGGANPRTNSNPRRLNQKP